jgi:hypothetical protein
MGQWAFIVATSPRATLASIIPKFTVLIIELHSRNLLHVALSMSSHMHLLWSSECVEIYRTQNVMGQWAFIVATSPRATLASIIPKFTVLIIETFTYLLHVALSMSSHMHLLWSSECVEIYRTQNLSRDITARVQVLSP